MSNYKIKYTIEESKENIEQIYTKIRKATTDIGYTITSFQLRMLEDEELEEAKKAEFYQDFFERNKKGELK